MSDLKTPLVFTCTNESLSAIIKGLKPKPSDHILAIAGSGDQAFALLEYGCRVTAIDFSEEQIRFISRQRQRIKQNRVRFLSEEKESEFEAANPYYSMTIRESRAAYFNERRVARIADSLHNLSLRHDSISRITGTFNKMYLSNASIPQGIIFHQAPKGTIAYQAGTIHQAQEERATSTTLSQAGFRRDQGKELQLYKICLDSGFNQRPKLHQKQ